METILELKTISEIAKVIPGWKTAHPMVAVIDFSKIDEHLEEGTRLRADFYSLMFKNYCANTLIYGRQSSDFQEGSLICIAPKHVLALDNKIEKKEEMIGWGLFFHPDLLHGTPLGAKMKQYNFFSYQITEALHLSEKEQAVLNQCLTNIKNELEQNIDTHSEGLILSNIELLLNYCLRYYGRQFVTRKKSNLHVLIQVENLLKDYFYDSKGRQIGLPTVKYIADKLCLSPGYLSDLLKKETGLNTQDHIHYYLIEEAKTIISTTDFSVSQVAYTLGFEYPQYFSRLFKLKTGRTPSEFRNIN
ncbi:transcriptional regulator [Flavobacterium sp. Root901]|uniref:helix-turn-helix domain-containing protein n=1 Tax=Flavobacterium sp. Root901 TaxID=1736605 RepID=UPI0007107597|nr:helix-turn-helix transcriptional regulator [Flavobacterium sp. Root901]KRD12130.1 transcriptional regulator [Flavobacterium sp. Root901]